MMKRIMLVAIMIQAVMATFAALKQPDFAFPKTVVKESKKSLESSLKEGDELSALRSLMDYVIANNSIGNDNVKESIKLIDDTRGRINSPSIKALVDVFEATVYDDIYLNSKWKYDNRKMPLLPLPEDVTEWSGEQFKNKITELYDRALAYQDDLYREPISKYSSVIICEESSRVYFPTLYDFVAHKAVSTLQSFYANSKISPLFMTGIAIYINTPVYVIGGGPTQKILEIYQNLLKLHVNSPAPCIYNDIQRLEFTNSRIDSDENKYREILWELYEKYRDSEYSGNILLAIYGTTIVPNYDISKEVIRIYNASAEFLKKFPAFHRNNNIRNRMSILETIDANTKINGRICPNIPFELEVRSRNCNQVTVHFYKVKMQDYNRNYNRYYRFVPGVLKPVVSYSFDFNGTVPFTDKLTKMATLPDEGYYIAVLQDGNKPIVKQDCDIIQCSAISIYSLSHGSNDKRQFIAVNSHSGDKMPDVSLYAKPDRNSNHENVFKRIGITDKNGFVFSDTKESMYVYGQKGTSISSELSVYREYYSKRDTSFQGNVYTSLPIYKPGDSLKFAIAANYSIGKVKRVLSNRPISVILVNANNQSIDTLQFVTDMYGRAEGTFMIPTDELTGSYRLKAFYKKYQLTYQYVSVSDYKLPTYYAKFTETLKNTPNQGDITLVGEVKTYSGVPVSSATVKYNLSGSRFSLYRYSGNNIFYTDSTTTDSDGKFRIVIPDKVLTYSPYGQKANYSVSATVSSVTGENVDCSHNFNRGESYVIVSSLPAIINAAQPVKSAIKLLDNKQKPVKANLVLIFSNDVTNKRESISINTEDKNIELAKVPSGKYNLVIKSTSHLADSITNSVIIFRPGDTTSPEKERLWFANNDSKISVPTSGKTIYIGAPAQQTHVLYTLCADSTILEQKWIQLNKGINELKIEMPKGYDNCELALSSVYNFVNSINKFNLVRENSKHKLSIKTESFRNKIEPFSKEKWVFNVVDQDSTGTESAMIVGMWSASINSIKPMSWTYNSRTYSTDYLSFSTINNIGYWTQLPNPQNSKSYPDYSISTPEFELYNKCLYGNYAMRGQVPGLVVEELKSMDTAGGYNQDSGPRLMKMRTTATMNSVGMVMEDSEEEVAEATADSETADETEVDSKTSNNFSFRDSENPLAFFKPMERTDDKGRYTLSFDVPNVNTTWIFSIVAFDKDATGANMTREVVASKSVMVQPNLPRFLRCGDDIEIKANVFNNMSQTSEITATVEVFNPLTEEIISQSDTILVIDANGSAVTSTVIATPETLPALGYRIKVTDGTHTDGEQSLIDILPASQPVTESTVFYLNPDSTNFDINLPEFDRNATLTLQYCDNPFWYVVTALPGLAESEPQSAYSAANQLYSATVADAIMKRYPEIATQLRDFTKNPSDSMLVSMLERNSELKRFLLKATLWMTEAKSDTERMQRLALLLDNDNIRKVSKQAIATLRKLQTSSGGFKWRKEYNQPSTWTTEHVLETLGRLNDMSMMPSDPGLKQIITKALAWHQSETEEQYRKYPRSTYPAYARIRTLWPDVTPSLTGKKIINAYTQSLIRNWKSMSVKNKCDAINYLIAHKYISVSRLIMKSVKQFAETSPTKGMWWPSVGDSYSGQITELTTSASALTAMYKLDKSDSDIDKVRQWLILQKEAQSWGTSSTVNDVVYSIISTSATWQSPSEGARITVGSNTFNVNSKGTGELKVNLSPSDVSGAKLSIEKNNPTPAWGAVISQTIQSMDSIPPAGSDELSIEKRMFKKSGDKWISADILQLGDRIKIQLLIKVTRAIDYVAIDDQRAACLEPVDQLSGYIYSEGLSFYRENRDSSTNLFISNLPKGTYLLEYEMNVNNIGEFSSGIATLQSEYQPALTAHSAGNKITVTAK